MNRSKLLSFALGPVGAGLFGFITLPILAWVFTPEDVGRLSMLQVTVALAVILFSLGLDQAYAREFHESADKSGLLKVVLVPVVAILVVTLLLLYGPFPQLLSKALFGIDSASISLCVMGCLTASLLTRFLSVTLRMQEKGVAYSIIQISPKFLFLAIVAPLLVLNVQRTLNLLLLSQLAAFIMTLGMAGWFTRKDWPLIFKAEFDTAKLRSMLVFGAPLIFGGLMSWALFALDRVMLRTLSTYDELAVYSVASSMATGVTLFAGIFNTIWWPQVYKWVANNADFSLVDNVADQVLAVSVLVVGLAGLFSWAIGAILPVAYARVPYLLLGCMGAPLLYLLSEVTVVGINISRRSIYSLLSSAVAALANLAGNYWLIPRLGAVGATVATVIAFWIFLVVRTEFSRMLWRKFNRAHIYFWSFSVSACAVAYAMYGQRFMLVFQLGWVLVIMLALYRFREQYLQIYSFARHGIQRRNIEAALR